MPEVALRRGPGRPREFDVDDALDAAVEVFWRQGYDGTSLSDLTAAMGLNRPSLYAAFGNKEQLFAKVLERYSEQHMAFMREALQAPSAHRVAHMLLSGFVASATDPRTPPGCLTVLAAAATGSSSDPIRAALIRKRKAGEADLRARLARARKEGDLPANTDPDELARYLTTIVQGIAVQAASGATRAQLDRVVDQALRTWPR
jgi:AcrR family transcriptional regulator